VIPPALEWVRDFAASVGRASLGSLQRWDVRDEADPLRRVLLLRFAFPIRQQEAALLRGMLAKWAEMNNCVYRRSDWKGGDFCALIILKGLRPVSREVPWEER